MGTHPIFESDFDCLTEVESAKMAKAPQKSKEAKAKAASGGGKKSKKKWSKGKSRDKLQNMCLFDKPTNYKVITPSIVSDRMKIRGSLARRTIKELHQLGKIKLLVQHAAQMVYTRAIAVDDEEEEVETKPTKKGKK